MSCERPNVAAVYRLLLNHLKHITGSRYAPCCFIMGSRVPIPGCITFFTAIWRAFHSTESNDFIANFSFGITAAVLSMEPAQFLMSRASRTHRPLVTIEVAIFTHNSVGVQSLLHLLSRELHHVVSTTLSTSCPSSAEVTSLVSSCTRQSSVLNAKTRSSVPWHYQCTHEFSRVSGHFTHCWAYRPV